MRLLAGLLGLGAAPIAVYLIAAVVLGIARVNNDYHEAPDGLAIFVRSNGVHTDLLVPLAALANTRLATLNGLVGRAGDTPYLAFGWGDRAFYLQTRTWADLRLGVALGALSARNPSVVHVEPAAVPAPSDQVRALRLNPGELARLVAYLDGSFAHDAKDRLEPIEGRRYQDDDRFYEAVGHYSAFATCNEWVRAGLAFAGVRVPRWSPFTLPLFLH